MSGPGASAEAHSGVPDAAVGLVCEFEGFRPNAYLCPAGVPTIGYGSTRDWRLPGQPRVTMSTPVVTEATARRWVGLELAEASRCVDSSVTVRISDGQKAALCSFVYNLGSGAFRGSTLLRLLNLGDYAGCAKQFECWCHGGGKVLPGLVRRRAAERRLFETA